MPGYVHELPLRPVETEDPLDDVLRRVNRVRVSQGVDPLFELPAACTSWDGGGCVLERAFADLGIAYVDYRRAYGRDLTFEHGLGDFVRAFDKGRFPELRSAH